MVVNTCFRICLITSKTRILAQYWPNNIDLTETGHAHLCLYNSSATADFLVNTFLAYISTNRH